MREKLSKQILRDRAIQRCKNYYLENKERWEEYKKIYPRVSKDIRTRCKTCKKLFHPKSKQTQVYCSLRCVWIDKAVVRREKGLWRWSEINSWCYAE